MDPEQQPFTPQGNQAAGKIPAELQDATVAQASDAEANAEGLADASEEEQPDGASDWLSSMLQDLLQTEVKTALESVLLPRTKQIEQELQMMQHEAQSVGLKSHEEHAEVQNDLARMAQLVTDFQAHISQLLSK